MINKFWKKGWDIIDTAKGGYAETEHEYFERIREMPLLKAKTADVWYIGFLSKGEMPSMQRMFLDERLARETFETVKRFNESELGSRHRFERMTTDELEDWLKEFGYNSYAGESVYCNDVLRNIEFQNSLRQKDRAM